MGFATILWSVAAGISLTLAVMSGSVGLAERRNPASLTLFVLGLAVAASAFLELGLMHSLTASEYGEWLRWYHLPVFVAVACQLLFVRFYLEAGRTWLLWLAIGTRAVVVIANFIFHPNFNFVSINSLRYEILLGEKVSVISSAVPRTGWQTFASATLVVVMAYLVDAAVQRWRMGRREDKRKALVVSLAIAAPWFCTVLYTQSIVFGASRLPISNLAWFLGTVLVMTFELTRDYVLSRRALVEFSALQRQLMQQERVSVLGQLSSALAHQLIQPMTANATNVAAALKHLEHEKPDLVELREILVDIGKDSRRAGDVITGLRQLMKDRQIELRPVRMEDVVEEALALVREEATARRVALSLAMQPDLPQILGDRLHLSQVMINLLLNSLHAVQVRPPEARRVVVEARADDRNGEVEVSIRDSGPGIAEGAVDEVFGLFFTTKPDGMGVGLALSRTIIEAHGGRLWLDRTSARQDGAVFRFTLQRA